MDLIQPKTSQSQVLKAAVNAFNRSIMHHGPYDVPSYKNVSTSLKVVCVWPQGDIWNNEGKCLYICDAVAFNRLLTAMDKVLVIDKGVAWPHVNFATKPSAVQWLMWRDASIPSSDSSLHPSFKKWFTIPLDFQDIMDYVASLHNLLPVRSRVSLVHQVGATITEGFQCSTQAEVSFTSIIVHPGDITTSFSQPSPDEGENLSSYSIHTKWITGKNSFDHSSHRWTDISALVDTELQYHYVTNKLPQVLMSLIANRIQDCTVQHEVSLSTQITIKEEPLTTEMTDLTSSSALQFPSESHDSKKEQEETGVWAAKSGDAKRRLLGEKQQKHFGRLLQCPKCPAAFKFGLHGRGLHFLMRHVNDRHKRYSHMCTSVIKEKYAAIMKDTRICITVQK